MLILGTSGSNIRGLEKSIIDMFHCPAQEVKIIIDMFHCPAQEVKIRFCSNLKLLGNLFSSKNGFRNRILYPWKQTCHSFCHLDCTI